MGSAANGLIVVDLVFGSDLGTDAGYTLACTFAGTSMTAGTKVHTNNSTGGFIQRFYLVNPATGSGTVSASFSGTGGNPSSFLGGSVSYTGANQITPLGSSFTAVGSSGTASAAATSNTNGNILHGGVGNGSPVTSATSPSTSRWIKNQNNNSAAGNGGAATSPATGSSVTMAWTVTSDFWAVIINEILAVPAAGGPVIAPPPPLNQAFTSYARAGRRGAHGSFA